MTRARVSLPLLLTTIVPLALAACATQKKPLTGFDKQPPGTIVLDNQTGGMVNLWPMFDLPTGSQQIFRLRLGGQDAVTVTSPDGFYDYTQIYLSGWTAGWNNFIRGIPPATYVVELVDDTGQSWGQSTPLPIPAVADPFSFTPGVQLPAVIFAHFDGHATTWTIDPALQDVDGATDEITVTNLVAEDVLVERCQVVSGSPTSCTPVGTAAPGADLHTVETIAGTADADHAALIVRLASDANQSYQRDLVAGSNNFGSTCQIERIIVHGARGASSGTVTGRSALAMSSCYGSSAGPP